MLLLQKTLDTLTKLGDVPASTGADALLATNPVLVAVISVLGGGFGVKLLEWLLNRGRQVLQDNATLRQELMKNLTDLRNEVKATHDQKVELYEQNRKLRQEIDRLDEDKARLSRRIRLLSDKLLDYDPHVFEKEREEVDNDDRSSN